MSLNFAAAVDNEHRLVHSWTWRYSIENKDKEKEKEQSKPLSTTTSSSSENPAEGKKDKEKVQLTSFSSVETFWCLFNNLALPSTYNLDTGSYTADTLGNNMKDFMNVRITYYIFKNGVDPTWEHPLNADGGFWQLYAPSQNVNEMWTKVVLALIGELLEDSDKDMNNDSNDSQSSRGSSITMGPQEVICGAEIDCNLSRIRIWTRNSEDAEKQMKIGRRLRETLQLNSSTNVFYFKHGVRPKKENVKYNCLHLR